MIPTTEWMASNFAIFNKRYFDNKLKTPKFVVGCDEGCLGQFYGNFEYNIISRKVFNIKRNTLYLTDEYDRREKDVLSTLLHEMIHAYIWTVSKVCPINDHDWRFKKWANKINKDGWSVAPETELKRSDKYVKNKKCSR